MHNMTEVSDHVTQPASMFTTPEQQGQHHVCGNTMFVATQDQQEQHGQHHTSL